ncbi:hypothetical protein ALI22I_31525 [Saccharothrix sp. ALI-22-I]|nr:hypothetical protein ALI22I_31525 [Saccharothrix sp. ALI-22-I]
MVALIVTMGGGSNSTAKDAADGYVAAVNSRDFDKLNALTCAEKRATIEDIKKATDPGAFAAELEKELESQDLPPEFKEQIEQAQEAAKNIKVNLTLDGVQEKSDTEATATVSLKFTGVPDSMKEYVKDQTDELPLKKTDDGWVACPKN